MKGTFFSDAQLAQLEEAKIYIGEDETAILDVIANPELSAVQMSELQRTALYNLQWDSKEALEAVSRQATEMLEQNARAVEAGQAGRNTVVVNCFAGPDAGKSIAAMELASTLGRMNVSAAYVTGYAKELMWNDPGNPLLDGSVESQKTLLQVQNQRLLRLQGRVDIVVTDSPLMLCGIYAAAPDSALDELVMDAHNSYNNYNLLITRDNSYLTARHTQELQKNTALDEKVADYIEKKDISVFAYSPDTVQEIAQDIGQQMGHNPDYIVRYEQTFKMMGDSAFYPTLQQELATMKALERETTKVLKQRDTTPGQTIQIVSDTADRDAKMDELTEKLQEGIKNVFSSDLYKNYLRTMSQFHNYSYANSMLIMMQRPDATHVAGFHAWKNNFNRMVNKGEKGIMIMAPVFDQYVKVPKLDKDGNPVLDKNGEPVMVKRGSHISNVKPAYVFDVSQTDGEPLPEIARRLDFDVKGFQQIRDSLIKASGCQVEFGDTGNANGFFVPADNRIVISDSLPEAQTIKTLIHETAHARLHGKDTEDKAPDTREMEAESVAYIVSEHYGIDSSEYSFGYIAAWSADKDMGDFKSSLQTIQRAAQGIIADVDKQMAPEKDRERPGFQERMAKAKESAARAGETAREQELVMER